MLEFRTDTAYQFIGKELAVSDWLTIDQNMVTTFATTTLDPDWMHVDVARSRESSPYGGTIVQGFLMLSLVIYFGHMGGTQPRDTAYALNYGLDRVRFLTPCGRAPACAIMWFSRTSTSAPRTVTCRRPRTRSRSRASTDRAWSPTGWCCGSASSRRDVPPVPVTGGSRITVTVDLPAVRIVRPLPRQPATS